MPIAIGVRRERISMYYFLTERLLYWQNEILQAKLLSNMSEEHELNWLSGNKLSLPLPDFILAVPEDAPALDNYRTPGGIYNLYSNKLVKLLGQYHVNFELYKTKIVGVKNNKDLQLSHRIFRLVDVFDCLDETKTEFEEITIGKRVIKIFNKPVFTNQFLIQKKMLFRIAGYEQYMIAHETLKEKIEASNITGCEFSLQYLPDFSTLGDHG
jgi:hypothetical protein